MIWRCNAAEIWVSGDDLSHGVIRLNGHILPHDKECPIIVARNHVVFAHAASSSHVSAIASASQSSQSGSSEGLGGACSSVIDVLLQDDRCEVEELVSIVGQ